MTYNVFGGMLNLALSIHSTVHTQDNEADTWLFTVHSPCTVNKQQLLSKLQKKAINAPLPLKATHLRVVLSVEF